MSKVSFRCGSLMSPFHPTVVRGFSKYTRITTRRSEARRARSAFQAQAYSVAAFRSWMEHGPTTTTRSAVVGPAQDVVDAWRASKVTRSVSSVAAAPHHLHGGEELVALLDAYVVGSVVGHGRFRVSQKQKTASFRLAVFRDSRVRLRSR